MVNVFYITADTPRGEQLALSLPGNIGLVFGAMLLICFGDVFRHYKWTLCISWAGMVFWGKQCAQHLIISGTNAFPIGGMMAMVTPYNKGMMIAFTFLEQTFFGWAQYLSIAFTQLGVHQHDLGMSGGLAGVARYAGGSLAQAIYVSILTNAQSSRAAATVPQAAMAAGATSDTATALLAAFPLGSAAIAKVPGINDKILAAAGTAFQWSYAHGLKITALASLSFGFFGLIMCFLCENIDPKVREFSVALLNAKANKQPCR
jgi:hypothetical protein